MDGFSFRVRYREAINDLHVIDRQVNRATMWTVREAGRKVRQAAARNAPVYKGTRTDVPKGRLKKSIHSDKGLTRVPGGWAVRVRPRGYPAQAYAPAQEERTPFMAPAHEAVTALAPAIAERAWDRAVRRR